MVYTKLANLGKTTTFNKNDENSLFYNNWVSDKATNCSCKNQQGQSKIPCSVNRDRYYCSEVCPDTVWTQDPSKEINKMASQMPTRAEVQSSIWSKTDIIGYKREESFIDRVRSVYSGTIPDGQV